MVSNQNIVNELIKNITFNNLQSFNRILLLK